MGAPDLVLASGSPRRSALLTAWGLRFRTQPADVDESPLPEESPAEMAARLARAKALAVAPHCGDEPCIVLAADTIVVLDGRVIGKPVDAREACAHLARLCGRTHRVITAVAVARSDTLALRETHVESFVSLREASEEEIRTYVASGEPLDKAGAYAVQGEGRRLLLGVRGSETNVIGLPEEETLALLRAEGITAETPRSQGTPR